MTERVKPQDELQLVRDQFEQCVYKHCDVTHELMRELFSRMCRIAGGYVHSVYDKSEFNKSERNRVLAEWMNDEAIFMQRVREQALVLTGELIPLRKELRPAA
jgi:hypothetical protein